MFSKLIASNSKRNRKDNSLFFLSMIIFIIAFYIILSLSNQDVMIFLKKMESDAVEKLFALMPVFYVLSLYILFFLIYFVSRIQMERRNHEFGIYLTLGMKRSKLFKMLLIEDFRNNIIAISVGLPIAIFLSEIISLVTAKIVGLGIIGHSFSFSFRAVVLTVGGFLLTKFLALIILSGQVSTREIGKLLSSSPIEKKNQWNRKFYIICMITGIVMLSLAYKLGIIGKAWQDVKYMGITVFLGATGTVFLFFGMRVVIGFFVKLGNKQKLGVYNFRQIQELVMNSSTTLAVSSLLVFGALCLFGAGVSISTATTQINEHNIDYTFEQFGSDSEFSVESIERVLSDKKIDSRFDKLFAIKVGLPRGKVPNDFSEVIDGLTKADATIGRDALIYNIQESEDCYLIALSGYNELLRAANKATINLTNDEVSLYMGNDFLQEETLINRIIKTNPKIGLKGETHTLIGTVQSTPIVTDRSITISVALIVTDEEFDRYIKGEHSKYINGILHSNIVNDKGLMKAIAETNRLLDKTSLAYESYIQNMGRKLFYVISASYITIYLAILFLVIANTILGVQFLMWQQKTNKRYKTLIHLGSSYETLCMSSHKQINWYFGLPIGVAILNSAFGVRSLFTGIIPDFQKVDLVSKMLIALSIIALLGIFEYVYILIVKKHSNKYILGLMSVKREE